MLYIFWSSWIMWMTIIASALCLCIVTLGQDTNSDNTVICPCGSSGKTVSVSRNLVSEEDPCSLFVSCENCEDGSPICSSFAEGFLELLGTKYKDVMVQCPTPDPPKFSTLHCKIIFQVNFNAYEGECSSRCLPGYHFENTEATELNFTCSDRGWEPANKIPKCVPGGVCNLDFPGSYNCTIDKDGKVCDISCPGKSETRHYCHLDTSWTPSLPDCEVIASVEETPISYCNDPGIIANGEKGWYAQNDSWVKASFDRYREGTVLIFSCNEDFTLEGNPVIICLSTGSWSDRTPNCTPDFEECGRSFYDDSFRMSFGEKTWPKEWPWQVAIAQRVRNVSSLFCGGVLITPKYVLTAAHCLENKNVRRTVLYFGKYNYSMDKDDPAEVMTRRARRFYLHPEYNTDTCDYDLAIIKLNSPIIFTDGISPVCLPTIQSTRKNLVPMNTAIATGWGLNEKNEHPDVLMMSLLSIASTADCQEFYSERNAIITPNMFCAGHETEHIHMCSGDSGGPVMFYDEVTKRWTVEGIVSFSVDEECGMPRKFSVYTKLGNFRRWISSRLEK